MESLNIINKYIKSTRHYINYETQDKDNIKNAKTGCKELNIVKKDLQELAQYRALAEQIGCPLEVLFRALNDGFYTIGEQDKCFVNENRFTLYTSLKHKEVFYGVQSNEYIKLKDYKVTWWLKADKSE